MLMNGATPQRSVWLSIPSCLHNFLNVSCLPVDEVSGLTSFSLRSKWKVIARTLKFIASRHVLLAYGQVHLSAVAAFFFTVKRATKCCFKQYVNFEFKKVKQYLKLKKGRRLQLLPLCFQSLLPIITFSSWTSDEPFIPIRMSPSLPLAHPHVMFLCCSRTKPRLLPQRLRVRQWRHLRTRSTTRQLP